MAAEAKVFARKLAAGENVAKTSQPSLEDWMETKVILYKRAKIPMPTQHRKAKAERTVEALKFEEMSDDEYKKNMGECVKVAAGAAMLAVRMLKDLRDDTRIIGHSVRGVQDQVRAICNRKVYES